MHRFISSNHQLLPRPRAGGFDEIKAHTRNVITLRPWIFIRMKLSPGPFSWPPDMCTPYMQPLQQLSHAHALEAHALDVRARVHTDAHAQTRSPATTLPATNPPEIPHTLAPCPPNGNITCIVCRHPGPGKLIEG